MRMGGKLHGVLPRTKTRRATGGHGSSFRAALWRGAVVEIYIVVLDSHFFKLGLVVARLIQAHHSRYLDVTGPLKICIMEDRQCLLLRKKAPALSPWDLPERPRKSHCSGLVQNP